MATNQNEKRAGLTDQNVRQGEHPGAPELTSARRTRRYTPRARKCAYTGCQNVFKPHAKHGRFCSDACRKAAARRKGKRVKQATPTPELTVIECRYCHNTFFAQVGKRAEYCSHSHRELAYRQRRAATVAALIGDLGVDEPEAADMLDRMGIRTCRKYLLGKGYVYTEQDRSWVLPLVGEPARIWNERS